MVNSKDIYGDLKTSIDRLTSLFSMMEPWEKDIYVNANLGRKLNKEESAWKTRHWPIFKKDFKPKNTFEELAFNFFFKK